jgi:FAD:protein FMN transferase
VVGRLSDNIQVKARIIASLLLFCAAAILAGCGANNSYEPLYFSGETMGTTYHITVVSGPESVVPADLAPSIESWLDAVNKSMSTYLPDSELSALNAAPAGEWLPVSPMMLEVLTSAQAISTLSGGAFDITIAPLVDLWGFGPVETHDQVPSEAALADVRERLGFEHLQVRNEPPAIKKNRNLQFDLSAIAKGFAADYVGRQLEALGLTNYLVEIGGDLLVSGHNQKGEAWRIGVEKPTFGREGVQQTIAVTESGVATSGDYRNFFRQDGQTFSHIIDPRLSRPVRKNLVSVTVIADSSMRADGLATAFTVMGAEETLALAERQQIAVYLISREGEKFTTHYSSAFAAYMKLD